MTLLVVPLATPCLVGIYDESGVLIEEIALEGKVSDALVPQLQEAMFRYPIDEMIYVNGPGSHLATKITYVTLKTLSLVRDIPLYGCSAFAINGKRPVKAVGSLYFVKEKETIITKKLIPPVDTEFGLPHRIDKEALRGDAKPDYKLPAV
jgi:tRNA A37 threonylcarbamoyladenosine modification protein TsaB